jgi:BirA family biotin operon repressor/biotin-[acetyl-CoA-carboxylase] ligase
MTNDTRIETELRDRTRFRRLVHVASCSSTQDLAADDAEPDDAVYWADHQTCGRGRQRREWHDEPGRDLAVTFRVRTRLPRPLALPAAAPVAVVLACEPLAHRELRIKWPNDVFLDGRKLAGLLIDAGVGGADGYLIGIGINCNRVRFPRDLETTATSLAIATGHEVDRAELLVGLAVQLDTVLTALEQERLASLEAVFKSRLGLFGKRVRVEAAEVHEGALTGLDFAELVLDDARVLPLGVVRSIRQSR